MHCEICKLVVPFGVSRNCLSGKSQSVYLFTRRVEKQTVVIIEAYHFCQLHTTFYLTSCCKSKLHIQGKLLGIIIVDF
jgi:hypothetical protein